MKNILAILFLALIAFCCKKEPNNPAKDLAGQWEWIMTYKIYPLSDSNPLTPKNTGDIELLVFNSNKSWYKLLNNVKTDSGTYSLGHGSFTAYPGALTAIYDSVCYYRNGLPVFRGVDYYKIMNDTLEFSPGFSSRYSSYTLPYNGAKFWIKK
jgi:hypothetical protein